MSEIKLQHIFTMIELLKVGARNNFVQVTTLDLSKRVGRSQQAVSKHLLDLEASGYVERVKRGQRFGVKITDKGFSEMQNLSSSLQAALESSPRSILFEGKVISGMGEGAYYMSLEGYRAQFKEKLGYEPYPGTLNIKLEEKVYMNARKDIGNFASIFIQGFSDGTRTYGWVKCYPATIISGNVLDRAAVLLLERTHHDDSMLEVIAPISIKQAIGIKNGDKIAVQVRLPS